jgi:hypothetical protein
MVKRKHIMINTNMGGSLLGLGYIAARVADIMCSGISAAHPV